jgi:hypothetical protein
MPEPHIRRFPRVRVLAILFANAQRILPDLLLTVFCFSDMCGFQNKNEWLIFSTIDQDVGRPRQVARFVGEYSNNISAD